MRWENSARRGTGERWRRIYGGEAARKFGGIGIDEGAGRYSWGGLDWRGRTGGSRAGLAGVVDLVLGGTSGGAWIVPLALSALSALQREAGFDGTGGRRVRKDRGGESLLVGTGASQYELGSGRLMGSGKYEGWGDCPYLVGRRSGLADGISPRPENKVQVYPGASAARDTRCSASPASADRVASSLVPSGRPHAGSLHC